MSWVPRLSEGLRDGAPGVQDPQSAYVSLAISRSFQRLALGEIRDSDSARPGDWIRRRDWADAGDRLGDNSITAIRAWSREGTSAFVQRCVLASDLRLANRGRSLRGPRHPL